MRGWLSGFRDGDGPDGGADVAPDGVERGEVVGDKGRHLEEVARADAGGEEGLVGVAEGGVGEEGTLGLSDVLGKGLGAVLEEHVPETGGRRDS